MPHRPANAVHSDNVGPGRAVDTNRVKLSFFYNPLIAHALGRLALTAAQEWRRVIHEVYGQARSWVTFDGLSASVHQRLRHMHPNATDDAIFTKINSKPAPRFYVTPDRQVRVVGGGRYFVGIRHGHDYAAVEAVGRELLAAGYRNDDDAPASLIPSIFQGEGRAGDFKWEIEQELRARQAGRGQTCGHGTLYIINENTVDRNTNNPRGRGNATARPYGKATREYKEWPFVTGVTTGFGRTADGVSRSGFRSLHAGIKAIIDEDLAQLNRLVHTGLYNQIKYSAVDSRGGLGTGQFDVAPSVKKYIMAGKRLYRP